MTLTEELTQTQATTNDNGCQIANCINEASKEVISVWLERMSGDSFLFSAYFCVSHMTIFAKWPSTLVKFITEGRVKGVDSNILK